MAHPGTGSAWPRADWRQSGSHGGNADVPPQDKASEICHRRARHAGRTYSAFDLAGHEMTAPSLIKYAKRPQHPGRCGLLLDKLELFAWPRGSEFGIKEGTNLFG